MKNISEIMLNDMKISIIEMENLYSLKIEQVKSTGEKVILISKVNIKNLVGLLGFCQQSLASLIGY